MYFFVFEYAFIPFDYSLFFFLFLHPFYTFPARRRRGALVIAMSPRDHRGLISVVQGEQLLPRPPFLLPHLHPLRPHKVFHQRREEHGARTTRHGLGMRDGTTTRGCTTSISTVNAEGSSRPPVICARRAVRIRQCIRSRRPASLRHHTLAGVAMHGMGVIP